MCADTTTPSKTIEIYYFDAGGGHRNAMAAISHLIARTHPEWNVVPVNLQTLLEPIDPVFRVSRQLTRPIKRILPTLAPGRTVEPWQAQDIYNNALKRGVTTGMGAFLPVLQRFISIYSTDIESVLVKHWKDPQTARPDLVISVIPNFNWALFGALRRIHPLVPYVTVITDLVDCPPHFWMEDQDQMMICGTAKAYEQAIATGYYKPENVHLVSGMILRENFYEDIRPEAVTRAGLGLDPDKPTAMIMFGGNGSSRATNLILDQFEKAGLGIQTIVMCGNNNKLLEELDRRPGCKAVGFVTNVADYMRLADFFIGKPGPGSLSEAIHIGLPVIVERNINTMPQERPNTDWVREKGAGIVIRSFRREVADAVRHMLGRLPAYKANIKANIAENRAVYEIVDILGKIMNDDSQPKLDG